SIYNEKNEPQYSDFAPDLDRFFFEFTGVVIKSGRETIQIVDSSAVKPVDWGEVPEKLGESRGPGGKTWFHLADLSDGRILLVNLDRNCHDPRRAEKGFEYDRLLGPICVSSTELAGIPNRNPVIAYTFSDWLEKTLDWAEHAANNGDHPDFYWDKEDFQSFGDAMAFTRIDARF
ncbi:MAG: hypothetical protein AAF802_15635, partial [Planctomycetota bacterium]